MKTLLLLLIIPIFSLCQTQVKTLTPVGAGLTYAPGITITNTTASTTLYADTLQANVFSQGRKYEYTIYCSLTTPVSLLPALTLTVYIGSQTLALSTSGILAGGLVKKPFKIHVVAFANGPSLQFVFAEVIGDNGALLLGSNYYPKSGSMTVDISQQTIMKLTAQFSSAVGLAGTTLFVENVYKEPF